MGETDDSAAGEPDIHHHPIHERMSRPLRKDDEIVCDDARNIAFPRGLHAALDRRQIHCGPRDLETIEGFKRVDELLLCPSAFLRQLFRTADFGRGFETIVQKLKRVAPMSLSDRAVVTDKQRSQAGVRFL
ncbi:MAG: hypothetical protein ABJB49_06480 [Nitrospirota bacterium]